MKLQGWLVAAVAFFGTARLAQGTEFGDTIAGVNQFHTTSSVDNVWSVSEESKISSLRLLAANPSTREDLGDASERLILPFAHIVPSTEPDINVVVDRSRRLLFYRPSRSGDWRVFGASVGRATKETPTGRFAVVRKQKDPWWYPTPSQRLADPRLPDKIQPGVDNPLGRAALYLNKPTYIVHGTSDDRQVGLSNTDGCVELHNDVAELLRQNVAIGDKVSIVSSDGLLVLSGGVLYFEVGPYFAGNRVERLPDGMAAVKAEQLIAFMVSHSPDRTHASLQVEVDPSSLLDAFRLGLGYPVVVGKLLRDGEAGNGHNRVKVGLAFSAN